MFEFELPDVGEGVAEGEIVAWHVEPGDRVTEDQVLAEVETDKAVVDLPSPVDGIVEELHAEPGDIVPVGSVVVTIAVDGEEATPEAGDGADGARPPEESAPADPGGRVFAPPHVRRLARELDVDISRVDGSGPGGRITEADVQAFASSETTGTEPVSDTPPGGDAADGDEPRRSAIRRRDATGEEEGSGRESEAEPTTAERSATADEAAGRDRTLAAPATRELARELGVDIDAVPTDQTRDGDAFVEPADVRAYAESAQPAATGTATGSGAESGAVDGKAITREPYRGIRRTIGERMAQSASTIPHATHHDTAVVPDLVETRAELKPRAAERGVKLTYVPFVLKAVVAGLQAHPVINTELDEEAEEIVYKEHYDIGVAVATDAGLMVPVVETVDRKSLLDLAREVNDLVERARNRDLTPEELRGSTFTITNFGAIGGEYATPIINHPETAILGLGSIEQRPVVVSDGEKAGVGDAGSGTGRTAGTAQGGPAGGNPATGGPAGGNPATGGPAGGSVVARHTLPLSLSIDHRVIDGAEGAQFCNTVIEHLENPALLML